MKTDKSSQKSQPDNSSVQEIARKAQRLHHSRTHPTLSPLRGLSAFGVIGWSVAVPTVAGALLGIWLDKVYPQSFSWPVALILGGIVLGVMVAWEWIARQQREEERDAQRALSSSEAQKQTLASKETAQTVGTTTKPNPQTNADKEIEP